MKTYKNLSSLPSFDEAFVTIGNFDGLHVGHQKILGKLCRDARLAGGKPTVAVTFEKAPIETLNPRKFRGYLFPPGYKKNFLEKMGIGHMVSLSFNSVRDIPADKFIEKLLKKTGRTHLYVGYNFRFGKGNTGSAGSLERESRLEGFDLTVIDRVVCGNSVVSSSSIRELVSAGDVEKAGEFLGRPYFLASTLEKGDGIGSKIGFPTLNLKENGQVLPGDGVYFTLYQHRNAFYPAMTYVGRRPTLTGNNGPVRIETNVLEFGGKWADVSRRKEHRIFFVRRTRGEKKLHNLDELREILYNDRKVIMDSYNRYTVPKILGKIFTEE